MDFSELTDDLQQLTQTEFLYLGGVILALTFILILLAVSYTHLTLPTSYPV